MDELLRMCLIVCPLIFLGGFVDSVAGGGGLITLPAYMMAGVPVHFAANADALAKFDGTYLYEYDSDVGQSEWGTCNFNYYRREVCSFLSSAAGLWMDVYHCDGIRMDAISRALYWPVSYTHLTLPTKLEV